MSDAMIEMAPGSRYEDEILLRWRQEWGNSTNGQDYETWLECRLLRADDELDRLTREIEHLRDDPELDGTDGAHPAFWRGQDSGIRGAVMRICRALDGSDDGSGIIGDDSLESARREAIRIKVEIERLQATLLDEQSRSIGRAAKIRELTSELAEARAVIEQMPKLVELSAVDTIRNFLKYGHEMSERDCYPSLYRRGDKWRYHRRIAGNEWEDDVNPVAAAEKARK